MTCDRLRDWLSDGPCNFSSTAGSGIITILHRQAEMIPCLTIIQCAVAEQYSNGGGWGEEGAPSSFVLRTQARLLIGSLSTATP